MTSRLRARQRVYFAVGGVAAVALGVGLGAAGFALSGIWPGVSWAIGGALSVITLLLGGRWLWAAIHGMPPKDEQDNPTGRGTV